MAADRRQDLAPTVRAAAAALGKALGRKVRVHRWRRFTTRGRRNALIRCRLAPEPGVPRSVVIKKVLALDGKARLDANARERLRQDWAGAAMLGGLPAAASVAPRFFAGDFKRGFIVMQDMGTSRASLVQPFLGKDRADAAHRLVALAKQLGRMHAATAGLDRAYRRLVRSIDPGAKRQAQPSPRPALLMLVRGLVEPAPGFAREIATVQRKMRVAPDYQALLHRDPCPDNVMRLGTGLMLHDFEFAGFGHPLMDAAYFRMMFPTCWCAGAIPAAVVARAERAYRQAIAKALPDLAQERLFLRELEGCCARWVHIMLNWHLEACLKQDRRWGIAGARPRVLARLQAFVDLSRRVGRFPAHRVTVERLLAELRRRWPDAAPLPLYPAFRRRHR